MKNSMTPSVIEPATFLFVAQYLDRCAIAFPYYVLQSLQIDKRRQTNRGFQIMTFRIFCQMYQSCTNSAFYAGLTQCHIMKTLYYMYRRRYISSRFLLGSSIFFLFTESRRFRGFAYLPFECIRLALSKGMADDVAERCLQSSMKVWYAWRLTFVASICHYGLILMSIII
jgi:hypothetical protein